QLGSQHFSPAAAESPRGLWGKGETAVDIYIPPSVTTKASGCCMYLRTLTAGLLALVEGGYMLVLLVSCLSHSAQGRLPIQKNIGWHMQLPTRSLLPARIGTIRKKEKEKKLLALRRREKFFALSRDRGPLVLQKYDRGRMTGKQAHV